MSEATNIGGHLEKSYLAAALLLGTVVVETRDPNLVNTLHKMLFKVVSQIESTVNRKPRNAPRQRRIFY